MDLGLVFRDQRAGVEIEGTGFGVKSLRPRVEGLG
jgi:hypothetical protein